MKISTKRRLLSLLMALAMTLSLVPAARLAGNEGGEEVTGVLTGLRLSSDAWGSALPGQTTYELILEPESSSDAGAVPVRTLLDPNDDEEVQKLHVSWSSSNTAIVNVTEIENGHTGMVYGVSPGDETVTVTAGTGSSQYDCTIHTIVSGITVSEKLTEGLSVAENQSVTVRVDSDFFLFGNAASENGRMEASVVNNKPNIRARVSSDYKTVTIEGREAGDAIVELKVTSAGNMYTVRFPVNVTSNESIISYTEGCSPSKPLKFSVLEQLIANACQEQTGYALASVIGLSVPTTQGTLYLGYNSPEDTGAGVGSSLTYYTRSAVRGPYLQDITFVPNASYAGEKAVITFTGQTSSDTGDGMRSFKGRIEITLTQEKTDITVSTKRETPLKLEAGLFGRACQEQTGSPLSYVVFTLPPVSQGTLYTGYKDEWDYAAKVSASEQYKQSKLSDITFVPAAGFVGNVTISYAGYSISGSKYSGQLVIQVKQGVDDAITYNDNGRGYVSFSRQDFDRFCENATGRLVSNISFTPPPANQGKLYLGWNGAQGMELAAENSTSALELDWIAFVAAEGFNGVVRIPFSGVDLAGETFKGTVEVHIKTANSGNGDVAYTCAPGQSVKLVASDFANLCQTLTGQKLHYISFQTLPDFNMGAIYHNRTSSGGMGTRVTTAAKYFNSATPYISNLSFWATENFRGSVRIPFTGAAVTGETFTGLLYISSGQGEGSGSFNTVSYSVTGGNSVSFSGQDFDTACRQATNSALSSVRFDQPSSGQGILYYDYRASNAPRALSSSTNLYRTGEVSVDKVSFMPASGFSGVVYVPFTGQAINGTSFSGNVEITVRAASALGGLVRYETTGAPVHIRGSDVLASASTLPVSLRITALPNASQGKLYYNYTSPTKYSWRGDTSTEYSLTADPSVSNLTFLPKAGYAGMVEIPFTAVNMDGTSYTGAFRITVTAPYTSANFDDLKGYSSQYLSAVDYLYSMGVTNGTGGRNYEPNASIRRGDFCLMLSRAFQFTVGGATQGFRDVPDSAYYAAAVNEMYALGVVNGVGGGKFVPSASITRQEAALMVQRALRQAGIDAPDGNAAALAAYSDRSQVSSYAQGAVGGLAQQGLFPVASSSTLDPKANLTRADMALLLHRAMTQ